MSPAVKSTVLAITPLHDVNLWARGKGLEIVLFVTGAILLTRLATWLRDRVTNRIEAHAAGTGSFGGAGGVDGTGGVDATGGVEAADAMLRDESAKHRHSVAQVATWAVLVLVYCLTAVLVFERLGLPLSGFVAPAAVVGVALGFGAQRIVQDVLAGFLMAGGATVRVR